LFHLLYEVERAHHGEDALLAGELLVRSKVSVTDAGDYAECTHFFHIDVACIKKGLPLGDFCACCSLIESNGEDTEFGAGCRLRVLGLERIRNDACGDGGIDRFNCP